MKLRFHAAAFNSCSVFSRADRDDGSAVFDVVNEDDSLHSDSDDDNDDAGCSDAMRTVLMLILVMVRLLMMPVVMSGTCKLTNHRYGLSCALLLLSLAGGACSGVADPSQGKLLPSGWKVRKPEGHVQL